MLVQLAPNINEIIVSDGSQFFCLTKGDQVQLYGNMLMKLLNEGKIVKAEYPEILNDEIISIRHSDELGWRPIGKLSKKS